MWPACLYNVIAHGINEISIELALNWCIVHSWNQPVVPWKKKTSVVKTVSPSVICTPSWLAVNIVKQGADPTSIDCGYNQSNKVVDKFHWQLPSKGFQSASYPDDSKTDWKKKTRGYLDAASQQKRPRTLLQQRGAWQLPWVTNGIQDYPTP